MDIEKGLLEPLTNQEKVILQHLAEDMSNQEIADRLFLSVSTVKWYVRQLNSKLDTTNREEIVQRAAVLGLLQQPGAAPVLHNLPQQTMPFVGRQEELLDLQRLLAQEEIRLITLLAPGGMGKTRLAIQAALEQVDAFADGVVFVDLAPHNQDRMASSTTLRAISHTEGMSLADFTGNLIADSIANALGYHQVSGTRTQSQQIIDYLADKHKLILLDNMEHLLEGVPFLSDLLQQAPRIKLLATSRERLNLLHETVYPLSGLGMPDILHPDALLRFDSARLFVQAAARLRMDFEVTSENVQAVATICQVTEGMPLGLLLAASWLDTLTLQEVIAEIQHSLDFLEAEVRDLPARQRSIRAVFEASWKRLSPEDRDAFARLSVFSDGFTREAALEVAGTSLLTLRRLVSKALVTQLVRGRYRIHELLRQYAARKLADMSSGLAVVQAHTRYFADFAAQHSHELYSGDPLNGIQALDPELANIRAAWTQAPELQDVAAVEKLATLWLYYDTRGYWQEMMDNAAYALDHLGDAHPGVSAELLTIMGISAYRSLQFDTAEAYTARALDLLAQAGPVQKSLLPRMSMANIYVHTHRTPQALALYAAVAEEAAALNMPWIEANAYLNWGHALLFENDQEEAERLLALALDRMRASQDSLGMLIALHNLGDMAFRRGDVAEAQALITESLAMSTELDNVLGTYANLIFLGKLAVMTDTLAAARGYGVRAAEINRRSGLRQFDHLGLLALVSARSGALDEARSHLIDLITVLQQQDMYEYLPELLEGLPYFLHAVGHQDLAARWVGRFLSMPISEPVTAVRLREFAAQAGQIIPETTLPEDYAATLQALADIADIKDSA